MESVSASEKQTIKTGRSFERLIARIQKSVHERAEIKVNEKLRGR